MLSKERKKFFQNAKLNETVQQQLFTKKIQQAIQAFEAVETKEVVVAVAGNLEKNN